MRRFASVGVCAFLFAGCAGQNVAEEDATQRLARENERRMQSLENSVTALNNQVAQLNNRVYEVRGKNGQRTAMTVVPVTAQTARPVAAPAPVTPASSPAAKPVQKATAPQARKINPAVKPAPLTNASRPAPAPQAAKAPAVPEVPTGNLGLPPQGPSGQIAAGEFELGLPPAEVPASTDEKHTTSIVAPVSQSNMNAGAEPVPVPVFPVSDLSLPPEHPGLPPMETPAPASAVATPAPTATPAPAPAARTTGALQKGEEAAYQNALKAARAGKTEEGIRLFRDFLQKYPNGRYAANADFWIGECLYSQGKYKDALNQYKEVNATFPTHHKNADALLKAAMSMQKMGDSAGAQSKYQELIAAFPNSDAAKRARSMGLGR